MTLLAVRLSIRDGSQFKLQMPTSEPLIGLNSETPATFSPFGIPFSHANTNWSSISSWLLSSIIDAVTFFSGILSFFNSMFQFFYCLC